MSQPRRRWLISVVLVLAVIAFVGFSMIPLISTAFRDQPVTETSPVASPNATGQQQKLIETAKGYEVVLQREPENQTALRGLAEARIQLLDLKGAVAPLEKLAALNPEQTQYGLLLAQVKQQIGDRPGASDAYRALLATNPANLEAVEGLVNIELQEKRPEAAVSLLQDKIATANQNPGTDVDAMRFLLAQVYATQQNYDQAIGIYDELISNDQKDFRPVLAKAIALRQQGKNEEAKPLFDNAAALAPAQFKDKITQIATPSPTPTPSP